MFLNKELLMNLYKYRRKTGEAVFSIIKQQEWHRLSHMCNTITSPKVLFFGTDNFSLPSLEVLHKNNSTLGVVTSFKSPANCVRLFAEQQQLPLYRWPVTLEVCRSYDVGVVVSFGHLIPERIIKSFPHGMINVHASLLPRWRGAAPIIYAIMNGDAITGVSIMKIEPKHFDIGDILAQRAVPIREQIFMPELHAELANAGAELLLEVIKGFPDSFEYAMKQNNSEATYAPKITSKIIDVNWNELTAQQLYRRFRALYGYKHLNTRFMGKTVQLLDIRVPELVSNAGNKLSKCGEFSYERDNRCLLVRCANNSFVQVHQLRIEGKKPMSATDFNNGYLKKLKGDKLMLDINKADAC